MKIADYIGEATAYDKKLAMERKEPLSWLKSISAFANTVGGVLLYGVSDNDELIGLGNAEKDAEDLSEIIKNSLDPLPEFELAFHVENGKKFLIVSVKSGKETPYYVLNKGHRDAYVRVGNESVKANATQLRRLVVRGAGLTWDALPSRFNRSNLAYEVLRARYYEKTHLEFQDSDFASFSLIDEDGNLTNAGALFADHSPVRHSRVFCTRWKGLDKAHGLMEAIDDAEYSGGLIMLFDYAKAFVNRNCRKMWRKTNDGRLEYPEYPERAYEEAIVNGLIHRDYFELGSEVHIDIYDDRLEVYSPGGMPSGQNVQNLDVLNVASLRRNPVIADLFQRMQLMERRGSGFKKIVEAYKFESEKRGKVFTPTMRSDSASFFVVLPNLNYGITINGVETSSEGGDESAQTIVESSVETSVETIVESGEVAQTEDKIAQTSKKVAQTEFKVAQSVEERLSSLGLRKDVRENMAKVIEVIAENPASSRAELVSITGISDGGIRNAIAALKEHNLIRRIGGDYGGHWEVVK